MSDSSLDPELIELLRAVVEDRHSTLVRTPKERLLRLAWGDERISPHAFDLTKAEKHLAQSYREEAAHILHLASVARMRRPGTFVFVEKARQPDAKHFGGTAERLVGSAGARASLDESIVVLLGRLGEATASQLAAASQRLVPSDSVRIALGLSLHTEGQSLSALHLFGAISSSRGPLPLRSLAAENRGMVHGTRGHFERSLACYLEASTLAEERLRPHFWAIAAALQAGRGLEAFEQARYLEENGTPPSVVDELIEFLRVERQSRNWIPTAKSLALIPSLRDRMPNQGRRICETFQVPHE